MSSMRNWYGKVKCLNRSRYCATDSAAARCDSVAQSILWSIKFHEQGSYVIKEVSYQISFHAAFSSCLLSPYLISRFPSKWHAEQNVNYSSEGERELSTKIRLF